jgi:hypothetical protein
MTVLWAVTPFSFVQIDRRFRDDYCRHHLGDYRLDACKVCINIYIYVKISHNTLYYNYIKLYLLLMHVSA